MNINKLFLYSTSAGLLLIALLYGAVPGVTLPLLFSIEQQPADVFPLVRAIMGLYTGFACYWFYLTVRGRHTEALKSIALFMLCVATGRVIGFAIDGWPALMFLFYFSGEIFLGGTALWLLKKASGDTAD